MGKEIKKCLIISGAPESEIEYYNDYVDGRFVISADSGYSKCAKLGIKPDLIIGDFDSSDVPDTDIKTIILPVRKDDTDTFFAVKYAIKQGFNDLVILGGIGSRFDHTYCNVLALNYCFERNVKAVLINKNNKIKLLDKKAVINKDKYNYFSFYAFLEDCIKLTTRGTQYDLTDYDLTVKCPLAQSNSFKDNNITVSYESGKLLLILSND